MLADGMRIEVHNDAIGRILRGQEVAEWVMDHASRAADAAGPGFVAKPFYGFDRVSAIVAPDSNEALTAFYDDSTVLTRAMGAARG